ncbi:hypothetical protein [Aliihoeflea sp. PC F10.4]
MMAADAYGREKGVSASVIAGCDALSASFNGDRLLMSMPGHGHYIVEGDKFARWHIDPEAGTAKPEIRSDISADFPTINQSLLGRKIATPMHRRFRMEF